MWCNTMLGNTLSTNLDMFLFRKYFLILAVSFIYNICLNVLKKLYIGLGTNEKSVSTPRIHLLLNNLLLYSYCNELFLFVIHLNNRRK